jgi:Mrp family chromosome partitioning ATPase
MSKYFQAMERRKTGIVPYADSKPVDRSVDSRSIDSKSVDFRTKPLSAEVVARTQPMTLAPVAPVQGLLDTLAASPSLRSLGEQLGASSAYNGPCRILITGCRPGDGVSTVAAAMALDMSQRLAARTILVEGQPRVALMHPFFSRSVTAAPAGVASTSIAVQGTQWPRLETARPEQMALTEQPARLVEDLDELLVRYRLAVIDLGVVRLDPRMLALARPNDPILIVARHLHTDRSEMIATANVLRNTGHPVAGVILNGYKSPLPNSIRRLFGMEA